jgi:hypothetical protein
LGDCGGSAKTITISGKKNSSGALKAPFLLQRMALIDFSVSLVSVFMAEMNVQSGSDLPDFVNPPPIQLLLR